MSGPARQSRSSAQPRSASPGRRRDGTGSPVRKKRGPGVKSPGLKQDPDFTGAARHALAFRRAWLVLLTIVLLTVGLLSAFGVRFF